MKKRLISMFLAVAMCLSLVAIGASADYDNTSGDLTYDLNGDRTVTITQCAQDAAGALKIPSKIDGMQVTAIAIGACAGCTGLTSVDIGDGVLSIGECAFLGCTNLTSVTVPASVTEIGELAMGYEDVGVVVKGFTINGYAGSAAEAYAEKHGFAFYNLGDPANHLEYTVNSDGTVTITGCEIGISGDLVIPAEIDGKPVTQIADDAFYLLGSNLTSVTIPDSVTSIGASAFESCGLTSVTLGNGITSIGEHAFSFCKNLTSITIPDCVTSIGDNAFASCENLTDVTIGNHVSDFGESVFSHCENLTKVTIGTGATGSTSIGKYAFSGLEKLPSVTLGNGVARIGNGAFSHCNGLTSITIGTGVTTIEDCAFEGCGKLTSVTIPKNVTEIGYEAFGYTVKVESGTAGEAGYSYYYEPMEGFTIYGYTGTAAEDYANYGPNKGKIIFIALDDTEPTPQFTDVKESDWFYSHVTEAVNRGLMVGTGNNQFSPRGTTSRAMVVQILYNMAGKPAVSGSNPFTDVSETAWYSNAIQWAYKNGVTAGTSETTFSPNEPVTREQVARFLYVCMGEPEVSGQLTGFEDPGKVSTWAESAVLWATQSKIINGSLEGGKYYLNPRNGAIRAETATMMVKFDDMMQEK